MVVHSYDQNCLLYLIKAVCSAIKACLKYRITNGLPFFHLTPKLPGDSPILNYHRIKMLQEFWRAERKASG